MQQDLFTENRNWLDYVRPDVLARHRALGLRVEVYEGSPFGKLPEGFLYFLCYDLDRLNKPEKVYGAPSIIVRRNATIEAGID